MTSDKSKKAFTIRVEPNVLNNVEKAASNTNLKSATQARTYLELSQFIITQSNGSIEAYDKTPLGLFPKKIWGSLLNQLPENTQIDIGDSLGMIILTNCDIMELDAIEVKIKFLTGLGWLETQDFPETKAHKKIAYIGILAGDWPLTLFHAMMYRILAKVKYPSDLNKKALEEYLSYSDAQLKKLSRDKNHPLLRQDAALIYQFKELLGGRVSNFSPDCVYYIFDKFIRSEMN